MKRDTNDDPDPNEPAPESKQTGGIMGRSFAINGAKLKPFSFAHRVAFYRIKQGDVSQLESDALFLFVLTKDAAELDLVRGEARESAFRLEACAWAEKQPMAKIMETAKEINDDLDKAMSVEPAVKGDGSGNA